MSLNRKHRSVPGGGPRARGHPSAGELPTHTFVAEWVALAGDAQAFIDTTVTPYLRRRVPEHVLRRFGENAAKIPRAYLERKLNLVSTTSLIERAGLGPDARPGSG